MERFFRFRVQVVCFALLIAWCAEGETSDCVVVEVFGYETANADEPVSQLHRRAVQDALKNAVLQAQVELDVQTNVEGLRVKDRRVRSRSMGRVESSQVLMAGFLPSTNSPSRVYRVRMEVSVQPLSAEVSSGRWCPAVSLSVHSSRGEEYGNACREMLISSLRECGIRVVDAAVDSSAYSVTVALLQSSSHAPWEIQWEMSRSSAGAVIQEYTQVAVQDLLSSVELDKLGVRMAQDALRFWSE
jgi:hypothetical protein